MEDLMLEVRKEIGEHACLPVGRENGHGHDH